MEQASTVDQNEQQHKDSDSTYVEFLNAVKEWTVEQVRELLSQLKSTNTAVTEINENGEEDVGETTSYRQELLKALAEKNIGAVWSLIAEGGEEIKTLETLNSICETVAEHEGLREAGLFSCMRGKLKSQIRCNGPCGCCLGGREQEGENYQTKREREEEQQWINLLSDPLYIGLNWLWRNNPNGSNQQGTTREDVIEGALHDANLLEKIALYEHHYSRDEYTRRAEAYEKFAIDVVEGSTWDQLLKIMDDKGTGCLLTKKPGDFNQSLSLLKTAADKERKLFVASPKCQQILDEVIYYQWPHWQDAARVTKFAWSIVQLLMVAISCFAYIPLRLLRKSPCFEEDDGCWWNFRKFYEHPFSKFINHSTWYMVFLVFVILNSMQQSFATRLMGLGWIDYVIFFFALGFLMQEFLEAKRQGSYVYMSKWWNVVDMIIIFTFLGSYVMWLISWGRFGKWDPRKEVFVIADVLYASATVVAFFHLTHIFQIDSVLGPLQLSLYKMLKDVGRFLFIYLLLYLSFATGVVKVYSFYVTSQIELQKQNMTSDPQDSHPYDNHPNSLLAMFWLLLGLVEEGDIAVKDPSFRLTSAFGRLFLMAYVICTVIVALNMLIAMMNNSFEKIMDNADVEWKFSRARMWLEWVDKGSTIPAPLNLIYYTLFGLFKFFGWCLRISVEKCPCFNQKDEERNGQGDRATYIQKRKETLKDLIVKYLKEHYLENNEEERTERYHDETQDVTDEATRLDKSPKNIQENISLLREMVDRFAKELTELNKRLSSLAK